MNKYQNWTQKVLPFILVGLLLFAGQEANAQYQLECDNISAMIGESSSADFSLLAVAGQTSPLNISSNENHIFIPGFIACLTDFTLCTGSGIARMDCPAAPAMGSEIQVPLFIDMSGVLTPNNLLGSFSGTLTWDTALLTYVDNTVLQSGFIGVVNTDGLDAGRLEFNGVNATGVGGDVYVLGVTFNVVGAVGASGTFDLDFTEMSAAGSLQDLLPCMTVNDCPFTIDLALSALRRSQKR